ncbi:VOC family protein [Sabulicella glaciei]|uniref:VOC family protein n=1 Tax=Sabulicella glaciei TaxID=2984948 RepID=A0ABT3NSY4_9PROT|nr:VOC family protein [Roseococcus sp. MDT2-1-1]MCW8085261.1 VOC family protein [Roseococcus sp. MDT2-1-1]
MANRRADFLWYELMTPDPEAASRFYGAVLGWGARKATMPGVDYHLLGTEAGDVAGMMAPPPGAPMQPSWMGYVAVDDVDAAAEAILADGGAQRVPPTDIPGVGRFAVLTDPQGVLLAIMRGADDGTSHAFAPNHAGHCHWNELATTDPAAALAFHGRHFGWQPGDAMPMGELGEYRFLLHGGAAMGAVMRAIPNGPPPAWTFYFGVPGIDAAAAAITEAGGTIHYGPAEVPGNVFIVVASDPQGAIFGAVGPRAAS